MTTLTVSDMTCSGCANTVEQAIKSVDPTARVKVDLDTKKVTIDSDKPAAPFADAVNDVGYTAQVSA
jgi:copper chaperone